MSRGRYDCVFATSTSTNSSDGVGGGGTNCSTAFARHLSHMTSNCVSDCLCLSLITAPVLPFHYFTATRMLLLDNESRALQATAKSTISFFSIRLSAYVTGRQAGDDTLLVSQLASVNDCQWAKQRQPVLRMKVRQCLVVHTFLASVSHPRKRCQH